MKIQHYVLLNVINDVATIWMVREDGQEWCIYDKHNDFPPDYHEWHHRGKSEEPFEDIARQGYACPMSEEEALEWIMLQKL